MHNRREPGVPVTEASSGFGGDSVQQQEGDFESPQHACPPSRGVVCLCVCMTEGHSILLDRPVSFYS